MLRPPRRAARSLLGAALALLLAGTLLGCSEKGADGAGDGPAGAGPTAVEAVPTRTTIGTVAGRLDGKKRRHLQRRVTQAFDAWVEDAYVGGEYPRSDFSDAFAFFTPDTAKQMPRRDRALLSNAGVGERVDSVRATARRLRLDVLAPDGRAVGVTARFVLVLELDGELQRTDRVVGRLMLGYSKNGWQAFGYDVKRGKVA